MQNFNHSNQQPDQNQSNQQHPAPQAPKGSQGNQPSVMTKILTHLDVAGSLIMIISLFLGAFYKSDGGMYSAFEIPGYGLIFNSDFLLGSLLVILPIVVLISKYIESLKKYDRLISLVCLVITFMFVFVTKGQYSTTSEGALTFAMGAIIYLLGNVVGLVGAVAAFFGYDINQKVNEMVNKK